MQYHLVIVRLVRFLHLFCFFLYLPIALRWRQQHLRIIRSPSPADAFELWYNVVLMEIIITIMHPSRFPFTFTHTHTTVLWVCALRCAVRQAINKNRRRRRRCRRRQRRQSSSYLLLASAAVATIHLIQPCSSPYSHLMTAEKRISEFHCDRDVVYRIFFPFFICLLLSRAQTLCHVPRSPFFRWIARRFAFILSSWCIAQQLVAVVFALARACVCVFIISLTILANATLHHETKRR